METAKNFAEFSLHVQIFYISKPLFVARLDRMVETTPPHPTILHYTRATRNITANNAHMKVPSPVVISEASATGSTASPIPSPQPQRYRQQQNQKPNQQPRKQPQHNSRYEHSPQKRRDVHNGSPPVSSSDSDPTEPRSSADYVMNTGGAQ